MEELQKISKPLVEYLRKTYNPHTAIIVTNTDIRVVSDEAYIPVAGTTDTITNEDIEYLRNKTEKDVITAFGKSSSHKHE